MVNVCARVLGRKFRMLSTLCMITNVIAGAVTCHICTCTSICKQAELQIHFQGTNYGARYLSSPVPPIPPSKDNC